jgi:hypothetical protein
MLLHPGFISVCTATERWTLSGLRPETDDNDLAGPFIMSFQGKP